MRLAINDKEFKKFTTELLDWVTKGLPNDLSNIVDDTANSIKKGLKDGKNASGVQMKPVKEITMDSEVRSDKPYRRRSVNPDKNKPIQATGKTIDDIVVTKNNNTYTIASKTAIGDTILAWNQKLGRDAFDIDGGLIDQKLKKDVLKSFDKGVHG